MLHDDRKEGKQLNFIKDYWAQILFIGGLFINAISITLRYRANSNEAMKCTLRNDILSIYDQCREKKQITKYQLESLESSADIYFKLKGNSFVHAILDKVHEFEVID